MIPAHLLQVGDVILVSGTGLVSRAIRWFTNSEWSHVAIYVGGGKQTVIEAMEYGVAANPVDTMAKGHRKICVRRYPGLTVEQGEIIKDKAYSMTYTGYDFVQLVSMGVYNFFRKLGVKWQALVVNSRTRLICSEVVAVCYMTAGINLEKRIKLVSPASLYNDDGLVTVYEADL